MKNPITDYERAQPGDFRRTYGWLAEEVRRTTELLKQRRKHKERDSVLHSMTGAEAIKPQDKNTNNAAAAQQMSSSGAKGKGKPSKKETNSKDSGNRPAGKSSTAESKTQAELGKMAKSEARARSVAREARAKHFCYWWRRIALEIRAISSTGNNKARIGRSKAT
jgi:hypothetical protein